MACYLLPIRIGREEWLKLYRGKATYVHCQTTEGINVKIHAKYLQKFVTHNGIQGVFELELDEKHKFVEITQRN